MNKSSLTFTKKLRENVKKKNFVKAYTAKIQLISSTNACSHKKVTWKRKRKEFRESKRSQKDNLFQVQKFTLKKICQINYQRDAKNGSSW